MFDLSRAEERCDALIALALFHSLFNAIGILLFWPWQGALARAMERWLPSVAEPQVLITALTSEIQPQIRARYLGDSALASADAAARAVVLELQHLARLSLEVICHALYLPVSQLSSVRVDDVLLHGHLDGRGLDDGRGSGHAHAVPDRRHPLSDRGHHHVHHGPGGPRATGGRPRIPRARRTEPARPIR